MHGLRAAQPLPSLLPNRTGVVLSIAMAAAVAALLLAMGRVPICTCGYVTLWWNDVNSFGNSQMLLDWYSPSHLIHGLLFYFFAHVLFVRCPAARARRLAGTSPLPRPATHQDTCVGGRAGERAGAASTGRMPGAHLQRLALPIAIGFEGFWELLENSPLIIERYRSVTVNFGYNGDSVLNSMSDIGCMTLGFLLASRLPAWSSVALALGLELLTLWLIHDNLTLNVVMLLWPIDAIRTWQGAVA